jgi:hypothetical protein
MLGLSRSRNTANQSFKEGPLSSGFFLFLGWFIPLVLVGEKKIGGAENRDADNKHA